MDTIARLDFQKRRRGDLFAPVNWSAAARTTWVHARADRPEVAWYDYGGSLRQIARWNGPERALTDSTWSWIEGLAREVRSYRELTEQEFQERVSSWKEGPHTPIPVYGLLFADAAGNAWLGEWTPFGRFLVASALPGLLHVFGRDGTFVREIDRRVRARGFLGPAPPVPPRGGTARRRR